MDKMTYDQIQMSLGSVGDIFLSEANKIINSSSVNDENKALAKNLSFAVKKSLDGLAKLISQEMQL